MNTIIPRSHAALRLLNWGGAPVASSRPASGQAAMAPDGLSLSAQARGGALKNGGFEGGHYQWRGVGELAVPDGWDFATVEPKDPSYPVFSWLPESDRPFRRPETKLVRRDQLPEHERAMFVPEGAQALKVFVPHGPTAFELKQKVTGLVPGQRYRFTIHINQDIVESYQGGKQFPSDPHSGEVRLNVSQGGQVQEGAWLNGADGAPFGKTAPVTVEFVATGAEAEIALQGRAKWAFPNNGWFIDGARLEPVGAASPPPAPAPPPPGPFPAPGPGERVVTVRPGDSLYKIAREQLGDPARWRELYELNRQTIGSNPSLISPGMRLVLPAGSAIAPPLPPAPRPAPVPLPPAPVPLPAPAPGVGDRPLRLDEYPKANPVGAHGIPNYLNNREDADFVLNLLSRTGAKNTLLIVPFPSPTELRDQDRYFLEQAKARGITVQLRLGWDMKAPNRIDAGDLKRYTEQVAQVLGEGPYIQIANEPNLYDEWADGHKPDAAAFARWWIPYAEAVAAGGGYPGLPGMAAGAWNTPDGNAKQEFEFYEQMLATVAREAPASLDRAWTAAHPYHMYASAGHPDFVEDLHWQLETFNGINRKLLGRSLPVLVTESGYVDGDNPMRFDPGNAGQATDLARFKASLTDRPDWLVVGTADWLISNRHGVGQWRGIYGPNGEPTAFSQALEGAKGQWEHLTDAVRD